MTFMKFVLAFVAAGGTTTFAMLHVRELPTALKLLMGAALFVSILVGVFQLVVLYENRFGKIVVDGPLMHPPNNRTKEDVTLGNGILKPPKQTGTFGSAIGVSKNRIIECMNKNSKSFEEGIHYSLENNSEDNFGEILVTPNISDLTLNLLLRECSGIREN